MLRSSSEATESATSSCRSMTLAPPTHSHPHPSPDAKSWVPSVAPERGTVRRRSLRESRPSDKQSAGPAPKRQYRRRRTPSCAACATAHVRCVGGSPCARCLERYSTASVAAQHCKPVVWPKRNRASDIVDYPVDSMEDAVSCLERTAPQSGMVTFRTTSLMASPTGPSSAPSSQFKSGNVASHSGMFGLVLLPWDSMPFSGSGTPWVNPKMVAWLGYPEHVLKIMFNSYMGLCSLFDEHSLILFLRCVFNAINESSQMFECSVTMRCSNESMLSLKCVGSVQYGDTKSIFLQFSLPARAQSSSDGSASTSAPQDHGSASPAATTPQWAPTVRTATDPTHQAGGGSSNVDPWVIDPSPDSQLLGSPFLGPLSFPTDMGNDAFGHGNGGPK